MTDRIRGICMRKHAPSIAPVIDHLKPRLTVTHPFHPRSGETFELLEYRRSWGARSSVDCRDEDGRVLTFDLEWTDAAGALDPFTAASAGRSHFRVAELVHLVQLLKQLREGAVTAAP